MRAAVLCCLLTRARDCVSFCKVSRLSLSRRVQISLAREEQHPAEHGFCVCRTDALNAEESHVVIKRKRRESVAGSSHEFIGVRRKNMARTIAACNSFQRRRIEMRLPEFFAFFYRFADEADRYERTRPKDGHGSQLISFC